MHKYIHMRLKLAFIEVAASYSDWNRQVPLYIVHYKHIQLEQCLAMYNKLHERKVSLSGAHSPATGVVNPSKIGNWGTAV